MLLCVVEPTLLAFPAEAFHFNPLPNGGIGEVDAISFLERGL
jgi:hypothetical protein